MANRWGNNGNNDRFYFLFVSKITVDVDCSHKIKRCLLHGRKAMTNLYSVLTGWTSLQSKGLSVFSNTSSKASILLCSTFFIVQLSHPYMTIGKTIALTRQTFVGQVMSLLLNMLSRLVITFLPRSKRLLISWLQSASAVILGPPKMKSATVFTVSPSISHEGTRCHDLCFLNVEL